MDAKKKSDSETYKVCPVSCSYVKDMPALRMISELEYKTRTMHAKIIATAIFFFEGKTRLY